MKKTIDRNKVLKLFNFDKPFTAMELRRHVQSYEYLFGVEAEIFVDGDWYRWIDGVGIPPFSVHRSHKVVKVGSKYITLEGTGDDKDVKVLPVYWAEYYSGEDDLQGAHTITIRPKEDR